MLLAASLFAFASVLLLWLGLSVPVVRAYRAAASESGGAPGIEGTPLAPLVRMLTPFNQGSWSRGMRAKLDKQLVYAGQPGGLSSAEYLAVAELAAIGGFLLVLCLFLIGGGISGVALFFALLAAGIVYWLAIEYLDNLVSSRRKEIARQFPHFLDLAVMTMEAGSSFVETIDTYVRDNPDGALSEEFKILLGEVRMGTTLQDALENLHGRIPLEQVRNALMAVIQGQQMGTPLGKVMRDQSESMRFYRTQAAERAAEELKVKIMGPVILMMISIFILILGPAVIEVMQSTVF